MNGDSIDGVHHGSTHQISHNLVDQKNIAAAMLKPIVERCAEDKKGNKLFYMIRGTEVHSGISGQQEEELGKELGAKKDRNGQYSRYELWLEIGPALAHIMHHIGTTSSAQHDVSAINEELSREIGEAARWGERIPDIVVRSHRHRHGRMGLPSRAAGKRHIESVAFTTPSWQLKTPFAYRSAVCRLSPPQVGGSVIRCGDEDVFARHWTRILDRKQTTGVEKL